MLRNKITLRLYLPDFIENSDLILPKLEEIYDGSVSPITLYLWNGVDDEVDMKSLKDFITKWEDKKHFKTIIRNSIDSNYVDFIWFDIVPVKYSNQSTYYRFKFEYVNSNRIVDGLKEFSNILTFITLPKFKKTQKRTDRDYHENSNSRK
jgi:hypothetical protein